MYGSDTMNVCSANKDQQIRIGKNSRDCVWVTELTEILTKEIDVKQARKLQATLVRVRNYHPPTDLLTDGGEV